jgi:LPS-assembly protein
VVVCETLVSMRYVLATLVIVLSVGGVRADAQVVNISGYTIRARTQDRLSEKQGLLVGSVELERGDTTIYADQVEYFEDEDRALATGNVVFTQGANRIAADRAEFNTRTGLGTFYNASGISNVQPPRVSMAQPGIAVPTQSGQDTDVYFFGEVIEKLGPKKYKITNGGFSTCVQPTPRWDLTAGSVVLNVDDYTLLRNAVFRVKNVPVFYVPALYYPTKEDGRATGVLLPTYSSSNLRGHTISNAFFWAINRSSDATAYLDWFSKTGSGVGLEYRYALARGSGDLRAYQLNQKQTTFLTSGGEQTLDASREYTVRGSLNHLLPGNFRASANVDYFTSLITNQTFNTNINNVAQNTSSYGGNIAGSLKSFTMNSTFQRREQFTSSTSSIVNGTTPSVRLSRSERPLFRGSPIFFGFTSDASHFDYQIRNNDTVVNPATDDRSVGRFDLSPTLRYPFKKWQWFTVSSSVSWRQTYYTRSVDPETKLIVDESLNRQFFTVGSNIVGPVFNRIWNTPTSGYAERFKHTIEPMFDVSRTSLIDNRDRILVVDANDQIFGGTTTISYGVNNRLYAKRRLGLSPVSQAQEILSLRITQSYYTDARASIVDPNLFTSNTTTQQSNFGPVVASLRATPSQNITGSANLEFDATHRRMRAVSLNGDHNWSQRVRSTVGWSKRFFIPDLIGYNDRNFLSDSVNLSTNLRTLDNKYGTTYTLSYDIQRSTLQQQGVTAFYNAQCCGLAMQYQRQNFPAGFILPSDNRFFLSFTLAGLGNFSPFNGGLGSIPR